MVAAALPPFEHARTFEEVNFSFPLQRAAAIRTKDGLVYDPMLYLAFLAQTHLFNEYMKHLSIASTAPGIYDAIVQY
jgi:hypothetical protein